MQPTVVTYNAAIRACATGGGRLHAVALSLLSDLVADGLEPNRNTFNGALAACAAAPLLALAGASGKVKLLEYLAPPETEAEIVAEEKALDAAADSGDAVAGLLRSAEDVELHCNNVREVHFAGAKLFSAAYDEVAHWDLPLVPT